MEQMHSTASCMLWFIVAPFFVSLLVKSKVANASRSMSSSLRFDAYYANSKIVNEPVYIVLNRLMYSYMNTLVKE